MWLSQVLKYLSNLEFGPRNNSDDLVHYFIAALNSTLEVGVLYRQDMSTDGLLKDGGVRLPPDVSGSPPFDPTLKATILYFSYFTEEAQYETEDHEELKAIQTYGHIVASKLLKRVYDVDVHPDSIKAYYWAAADNARAVGKWDAYAVAEIISGQVQDEQTLRKVTSFLSTLNRVSLACPLMVYHSFASADWVAKGPLGRPHLHRETFRAPAIKSLEQRQHRLCRVRVLLAGSREVEKSQYASDPGSGNAVISRKRRPEDRIEL